MGNRTSKNERTRREHAKTEIFTTAINQVQEEKKQIKNQPQSLVPYSMTISPEYAYEVKEQQLQRRGDPLTKADLIAILCHLCKVSEQDSWKFQNLSCDDLRSSIRLHLYSPSLFQGEGESYQQIGQPSAPFENESPGSI